MEDVAQDVPQQQKEEEEPYIAHKLLTSSVAVFPPLPLSASGTAAAAAAAVAAEDIHVAHVLLLKGKWCDHIGHRREGGGGRMYLFVEEMMFLLEQGALEIVSQDMPLSIQEAYTILHETGVPNALVHPSSAYMTYGSLRNNAFILMRPKQFARVHTPLRASAAATAAASAGLYSASPIPPPQGKKGPRRRDAGKAVAPSLSAEQLQVERDRLREMQAWLPAATTSAVPASSSAAASSSSSSSPALCPAALYALLSTPCDSFFVWLPPGHALNNNPLAAAEGSKGGGGGGGGGPTFKKSSPTLPDFICVVTNPWMTFEDLWSVRSHCANRAVIAQFTKQRRAEAAALKLNPQALQLPCVGDVFESMYALSAERAAALPAGSASPLIPLRIAHVPTHQQRVFFIDWPLIEPSPSCFDLTQHVSAHKLAATMSVFQ